MYLSRGYIYKRILKRYLMKQTLYCTVLLYYCKVWKDEEVWKCKFGCLELSLGISFELGLEISLAVILDVTYKYFPKKWIFT